jgi:hypothetical protein
METTTNASPSTPASDPRAWKNRLADWRAFAAAAGATLAATSAADAAIIYGDPTVKPTISTSTGKTIVRFTIDGSGGNLQAFHASQKFTTTYGGVYSSHFKLLRGGIAGHILTDGGDNAINFQKGAPIGAGPFAGGAYFGGTRSGNPIGEFAAGVPGYAGFKLPASKGGGFGWMRIELNSQGNGVELIDYAYNNAGGGINADQGDPNPVPEPGSKALALLALGSAGVLAWRKRRSAAVADAKL